MGEAKRRRDARLDAMASGRPTPRPDTCPSCRSRSIRYIQADEFPDDIRKVVALDCEIAACLDCRAIWEPFPPLYIEDAVCSDPCDNCAFRPGSPEQKDPERWKALIETLKPGENGWFSGRFFCHKGVPIDQKIGPGNFLFPQKPILMDGQPIIQSDGTAATMEDVSKMRTCSGFLRMFWQLAEKQERRNG